MSVALIWATSNISNAEDIEWQPTHQVGIIGAEFNMTWQRRAVSWLPTYLNKGVDCETSEVDLCRK